MPTLKLDTKQLNAVCISEGVDFPLFFSLYVPSMEVTQEEADVVMNSVHGHAFELVPDLDESELTLEEMTRDQLRAKYKAVFGKDAPGKLSNDKIISAILNEEGASDEEPEQSEPEKPAMTIIKP
jgi:hypothetical protein